MAINRAPFNALVDDDGTNTTGTVWEKAQIAGVILDPVDAELLRVDGVWVNFTPALYVTGGTWSSPSPYVRYQIAGKVLHLDFSIEAGTLSLAAPDISIQLPFVLAGVWAGTPTFPVSYFHAGGADPVMATIPATRNVITCYRFGSGLTFGAGAITVRGHMTVAA